MNPHKHRTTMMINGHTVLWWLKAKFPSEYSDIVPMAGEFHGLAHLTDGIVILNWGYILEPILLHFDVNTM